MDTSIIELKKHVTPVTDISWQQPIPLNQGNENHVPYPIQALPRNIGNAITAYQGYGQQPLSLVACSALANISLACQSLADVARDRYLLSPVSVYFLIVAHSGERKSAADSTFGKATRTWQKAQRKRLAPELKAAMQQHQAWRVEKAGLLTQIKRNALDLSTVNELNQRLHDLHQREPEIPLLPELFFEDTTQEGMVTHLSKGWPSASLATDEGGLIMGGHGMQTTATKFIALLNRLWDGKAFIAHRKGSVTAAIRYRRLTLSMMMQPLILEQMLAKNGGISRQSGFLARCLMTHPRSNMGLRPYKEPKKDSLLALEPYYEQLSQCLNQSLTLDRNGCENLPLLQLTQKAKAIWVSFFNEVEAGLKHPHQWQSIRDFASKSAENAIRLAALFHLFNGCRGNISTESIEQAIEIMRWHLIETRTMLGQQPQTIKHVNAIKLLNWIKQKRLNETNPRNLQQYGPLRDKKARNAAIDLLIAHHYLKQQKIDGRLKLLVNPNL